uniref:TED_complement domain-containing protein n=1 Tax=Caenorhabditis tropicalis TaxID=1561998 RepID=A0A1I7UIB2_9PELO
MIHSSIESWYRVEIRKTSDGKTEILKCQNSWDTVVKKTSEIAPNVEFVKILCGLVAHPTILIDGMEWEVQGGTNCSQEKVKISEKATLKSVRSIVEAMKKEVKREKVFRVTSLITTWNSFLELESLLRGCCSSDDLKSVERLTLNVSPESRVPTHCLDSCMCGYGFPNSSCTTINYSHIPYELMLVGLATTVGCYTTVRFSSLHAEAREVWDRVGTKVEVVADGVMMKKKTINNVSFYHIKTPCGYFIHAVAKESNRCKKIIRLDYHMKKWIADANRECGLGWLCKRHASPFDFHYYQNIGKRVFFEPEWSDIQVEDFDPRDLSLKKSVAMARRMFEKEEKKKGKKGAEPKAWGFKEEDPEASFFKNLQKTDPKTAESYVRVSAKLEICKDYCTQMSEISEKSPDMEICHQQLSQLAEQMEKTLKMAKEGNFKVLIKLDEETKDLDLFLEDTDAFRAPEEVSETLKLNSENVEKGSGSVKKAPEVKNSPKNFEKAAPGSKKNVEKASESVKKVPETPSIPILKKETPDVRKVTSENQRNTMKVVRVKKATKEAPETQKSDSKDPSDSEFLTKLAKIDEKASEAYIFLLGLTNGQIPKKVLQIVGGKRNMEELLEKLKKTLIAVKMQTLTVFSVDGFNSVDVCLILNTIKSVAKHLGFASEDVPKSSDEEILKRMSNENKEIFQSLVKFLEKTDSFLLMTRCLLINAPISNKYSPEDIDQFQLLLGHLLEVNTRIERALGVVRERMTEAKSSSEIQSVMQEMKMMGEYARKIGTGFGTIEEKLKVRPDATPKNVEIVPETKTEAPIALKASEDVKKAPKIEKPADESLEDVKTVPKAPEEDEKIPEQVTVTLKYDQDSGYDLLKKDGTVVKRDEVGQQNVRVVSVAGGGTSKAVYFPIVPSSIGEIPVHVSAIASQGGDAVEMNLRVEPQGYRVDRNIPFVIDMNNNTDFSKTIELIWPNDVVDGSQKARLDVIGDMMGPVLNNAHKLVQMPYGCGEQNMLNLVPNILVVKYLRATNRNESQLEAKAIKYIEQGIQRELTYKYPKQLMKYYEDATKKDDEPQRTGTKILKKNKPQQKQKRESGGSKRGSSGGKMKKEKKKQ